MADEVGICNSALIKIGAQRIVSLSEANNKNARLCSEQYEKNRDDLLRMHTWNFAIKRAKLGQLAGAPTFDYKYAYQLPSDSLRVVEVYNNEAATGIQEYKIEGKTILSDWDDLYLKYVSRVVDVNTMTPDFQECLAWKLAVDLSIAIGQSNSIHQLMQSQFRRALASARAADGIEDFPEQFPETSWTYLRRGSLWGNGWR